MSTGTELKDVLVFHGTQPASTTAQTRGIERLAAIDKSTSGAQNIFMGLATGIPNTKGPVHHHGEAETAAYILSGRVQVFFGENFEKCVEAGAGDFLFVPANTLHIEANPYDEPSVGILCRAPDNIVVNIPE